MKKLLILFVVIALTSSGCEKDDVCDSNTSTTPRLKINFYDKTNPTVKKTVSNLALIAEGHEDEPILFNAVDSIYVPLKTTADDIKYKFVLNYNNTDPSLIDEDNLEFRYTRNNIYISRACGFKTLFVFKPQNPYVLTDAETPNGLWINNITILTPVILTENETHLKITF